MGFFNRVVNNMFDLALNPFSSMHPIWPLSVMSLATGILMLLIFRYTSDQEGIKNKKNSIKAHLLGSLLFKDTVNSFLSEQKNLLRYNSKKWAFILFFVFLIPS